MSTWRPRHLSKEVKMTLTALCERFLIKTDMIKVIELKDDCSRENLLPFEHVYAIEYSKFALYSVKYITVSGGYMTVYVTPPNDGYKKADF